MNTTAAIPMKIAFRLALILLAAAAGLVIGFASRGPVAQSAQAESSVPANPSALPDASTAAVPAPAPSAPAPEPASALATQLEADLSMSTSVTRWLYWLEAIERAQTHDLPRLIRIAQDDPAILRLIGQRWMELGPRGMFDWLIASEGALSQRAAATLGSLLRKEWARRDPAALIQALREAPPFGNRRGWRQNIASTIITRDPETGLRLFHEWHIESFGPSMEGVSKWAAENPRHAAEFAMSHPAGYASQRVMEAIGQEWGKSDPAAALEFATSDRDDFGYRGMIASAAMKTWAEKNLAAAGEWLASADLPTRNSLSPELVEAWAKTDPARALIWCENNLEGTVRNQAARGVLTGAAEKDVDAAARLVLAMEPSATRAEGAAAVAEKWTPDGFSGKPIPSEMFTWMRQLDPASTRRVLEENHWRWSSKNPDAMAAFLDELDDPEMPGQVYSTVIRSFVRNDPIQAIEWTTRLPETVGPGLGNDAFNAWRSLQPQSAFHWLAELPASDPRRQKYFETALTEIARYQNQPASHLAAIPETLRPEARALLETIPLPPDRRELALQALAPDSQQ